MIHRAVRNIRMDIAMIHVFRRVSRQTLTQRNRGRSFPFPSLFPRSPLYFILLHGSRSFAFAAFVVVLLVVVLLKYVSVYIGNNARRVIWKKHTSSGRVLQIISFKLHNARSEYSRRYNNPFSYRRQSSRLSHVARVFPSVAYGLLKMTEDPRRKNSIDYFLLSFSLLYVEDYEPRCHICDDVAVKRCAWCEKPLCLKHFFWENTVIATKCLMFYRRTRKIIN